MDEPKLQIDKKKITTKNLTLFGMSAKHEKLASVHHANIPGTSVILLLSVICAFPTFHA